MNFFNKINYFDEDFNQNDISKLTEKGYEVIKPELEKFFKEDAQEFHRRWSGIIQMIYNIDARIHYWENRRIQFLQIATALIAASLVAIVAIMPNLETILSLSKINKIIYLSLSCSSLTIFFGGLYLLFIWNKQNNPNYPFTKAYKIWRWHYRGAEKNDLKVEYSFTKKNLFKNEVENYSENLLEYKKNILTKSPIELLDQDLSQLFLLITNEKFKIKFVTKLRNLLMKTLILSFIVGLLTALVNLL